MLDIIVCIVFWTIGLGLIGLQIGIAVNEITEHITYKKWLKNNQLQEK